MVSTDSTTRFRVAVVGKGMIGSAAARRLSRQSDADMGDRRIKYDADRQMIDTESQGTATKGLRDETGRSGPRNWPKAPNPLVTGTMGF